MPFLRYLWLFVGLFFAFNTLLLANSQYKYSYMPKKVYENQVFPVTVICVSECTKEIPEFIFDEISNVQPLNDVPSVIYNGNDSFYTFYFKAGQIDVRIPRLFIINNGNEFTLPAQNVSLGNLKLRDDFCGVLAADMKIANSQVSNYDEKNNLVTFSVEAMEANLEDMYLNNVLESGIEHIKRDKSRVMAEFYFVVPDTQKKIKFTYFNTIKNQYVYLNAPIEFVTNTVVSQTDLNPTEDSFELLKKYSLMSLTGFFFLMFLFKRDFFYLVLGVISLITLLTLYIPHKKVCIKQGSPLFILPTSTSTMSTKVNKEFDSILLGEHGEYKKVEYENGIIGWIKDEDICKD